MNRYQQIFREKKSKNANESKFQINQEQFYSPIKEYKKYKKMQEFQLPEIKKHTLYQSQTDRNRSNVNYECEPTAFQTYKKNQFDSFKKIEDKMLNNHLSDNNMQYFQHSTSNTNIINIDPKSNDHTIKQKRQNIARKDIRQNIQNLNKNSLKQNQQLQQQTQQQEENNQRYHISSTQIYRRSSLEQMSKQTNQILFDQFSNNNQQIDYAYQCNSSVQLSPIDNNSLNTTINGKIENDIQIKSQQKHPFLSCLFDPTKSIQEKDTIKQKHNDQLFNKLRQSLEDLQNGSYQKYRQEQNDFIYKMKLDDYTRNDNENNVRTSDKRNSQNFLQILQNSHEQYNKSYLNNSINYNKTSNLIINSNNIQNHADNLLNNKGNQQNNKYNIQYSRTLSQYDKINSPSNDEIHVNGNNNLQNNKFNLFHNQVNIKHENVNLSYHGENIQSDESNQQYISEQLSYDKNSVQKDGLNSPNRFNKLVNVLDKNKDKNMIQQNIQEKNYQKTTKNINISYNSNIKGQSISIIPNQIVQNQISNNVQQKNQIDNEIVNKKKGYIDVISTLKLKESSSIFGTSRFINFLPHQVKRKKIQSNTNYQSIQNHSRDQFQTEYQDPEQIKSKHIQQQYIQAAEPLNENFYKEHIQIKQLNIKIEKKNTNSLQLSQSNISSPIQKIDQQLKARNSISNINQNDKHKLDFKILSDRKYYPIKIYGLEKQTYEEYPISNRGEHSKLAQQSNKAYKNKQEEINESTSEDENRFTFTSFQPWDILQKKNSLPIQLNKKYTQVTDNSPSQIIQRKGTQINNQMLLNSRDEQRFIDFDINDYFEIQQSL